MLNAFTTYKRFLTKNRASYGVECVKLIKITCQKHFLLHLESYLVYEKEHEVGHCYQLYLLLVVFLLSEQ